MMQWIIRGLDRNTGQPRYTNVEAPTEQAAVCLAGEVGMVVESCEPIHFIPGSKVAGLGLFAQGTHRDRYLLTLVWIARCGGLITILAGFYGIFNVLNSDYYKSSERWWFILLAMAGMGFGAAVAAVGELLAQTIKIRSAETQANVTN